MASSSKSSKPDEFLLQDRVCDRESGERMGLRIEDILVERDQRII